METQHELAQKEAEAMLRRIFDVAAILAKARKRHRRYTKITQKHTVENALYCKNHQRPERN